MPTPSDMDLSTKKIQRYVNRDKIQENENSIKDQKIINMLQEIFKEQNSIDR